MHGSLRKTPLGSAGFCPVRAKVPNFLITEIYYFIRIFVLWWSFYFACGRKFMPFYRLIFQSLSFISWNGIWTEPMDLPDFNYSKTPWGSVAFLGLLSLTISAKIHSMWILMITISYFKTKKRDHHEKTVSGRTSRHMPVRRNLYLTVAL